MNRLRLLLAVLLAVPLLGSDEPKDYDGAVEPFDGITGTWELTALEIGRAVVPPDCRLLLTFRGGTCLRSVRDGQTARGSYRLDRARKPARLDWRVSDEETPGRVLRFIYEVKGDTLRVANLTGDGRFRHPQGFDEAGVVVEHYQRVK
jgi:uncharacterized protein (TIGR03067 family)